MLELLLERSLQIEPLQPPKVSENRPADVAFLPRAEMPRLQKVMTQRSVGRTILPRDRGQDARGVIERQRIDGGRSGFRVLRFRFQDRAGYTQKSKLETPKHPARAGRGAYPRFFQRR